MTNLKRVHNVQPSEQSDAIAAEAEKLKEFSYIVSHDLGAPVRHIKQFTQLLCNRLDGKLSDDEAQFADILMQSADKIQCMLSELLEFSRIQTDEKQIESIDLNHLIKSVFDSLTTQEKISDIHFVMDNLPIVAADKRQLSYAFTQILNNSIKFRDTDRVLEIAISYRPKGDKHILEFADNGIGVPFEQREHAFRMFKTLHPDKYEGVGTGLPLSRMVIETHGGALTLVEADRGARIRLTLPS